MPVNSLYVVLRQHIGRYLLGRCVSWLLGRRDVLPRVNQSGSSAWLDTRLSNESARWGCKASSFFSQKLGILSIPGVLKFPNWVNFLLMVYRSNRIPLIFGLGSLLSIIFSTHGPSWCCFSVSYKGLQNVSRSSFWGGLSTSIVSLISSLYTFLGFSANSLLILWWFILLSLFLIWAASPLICAWWSAILALIWWSSILYFLFRRPIFRARCLVGGPDELRRESSALNLWIFFWSFVFHGCSFLIFGESF